MAFLHGTRRGEPLRESGGEIPLGFEGEIETARRKYLRQRKAGMLEDPSVGGLREVFAEVDNISI